MRRWGAALFAWSAVALVVASCEAPVGEPRTQLVVVVDTDAIVQGLVLDDPTLSGAGFLKRVPGGWIGAADPRRDGVALGR